MRLTCIWVLCLVVLLTAAEGFSSQEVSKNPAVQESIRQLMETNSCQSCNLAGAVLIRIDLSGADLEGANLAGAKLNLAVLDGANLKDANLQGASLGGADLAGADLRGANLTGAVLEGAYLEGAQMDGEIVTRMPYLEEGGPDSGETVFVESEENSKNIPFTNRAFVGQQEDLLEENGDQEAVEGQPGTADIDQSAPADHGDMAAEASESAISDAMQESIPVAVREEEIMENEQAPEQSKKIVMIAEAVIVDAPQAAAEPEEKTAAAEDGDRTGETPPEALPEQPGAEPVEMTGSQENSGDAVADVPQAAGKTEAAVEPPAVIGKVETSLPETLPEQTVAKAEPIAAAVAGDKGMEVQPETVSGSTVAAESKDDVENVMKEKGGSETDAVKGEGGEPGGPGSPHVAGSGENQPEEAIPVPMNSDAVVAGKSPESELSITPEPAENSVMAAAVEEPAMETAAAESVPVAPDSVESAAPDAGESPAEPQVAAPTVGEDAAPTAEKPVLPEAVEEVVYTVETPDAAREKKNQLVEMLLDDNRCVGCDLSGVDLSGKNLDEADLERANLQGANLRDADLQEANLKGADLRGADLRKADLREADLYRAKFNGADLTGARFEKALVDSVYADDAIGADFEGALQGE